MPVASNASSKAQPCIKKKLDSNAAGFQKGCNLHRRMQASILTCQYKYFTHKSRCLTQPIAMSSSAPQQHLDKATYRWMHINPCRPLDHTEKQACPTNDHNYAFLHPMTPLRQWPPAAGKLWHMSGRREKRSPHGIVSQKMTLTR